MSNAVPACTGVAQEFAFLVTSPLSSGPRRSNCSPQVNPSSHLTSARICARLRAVLVNLLIAMMNSTYEETMEKAALTWRVNFARKVSAGDSTSPV